MKTLTIVGVLTIMAIAYGINIERLRQFYQNVANCRQGLDMQLNEVRAEVVRCAMTRDGQIFNERGEFMKEAVWTAFEEAISDPTKLLQAKAIFNQCYAEAIQDELTGREQTTRISICALPTVNLFDKIY